MCSSVTRFLHTRLSLLIVSAAVLSATGAARADWCETAADRKSIPT